MAVNMEVVDKSISEEVDTQLSASNSMDFKDGVHRENNENVQDLQHPYLSFDNETIKNHKCERTILYAQLDGPEVYANELPDNRELETKEQEDSIKNKKENLPENMKLLRNDCEEEKPELASQNSTDSHMSQAPLAFTIDFGTKEVDTTKYQNLFERYNARHKRNLSTSKVEINTRKSGASFSSNSVQKQKVSSTHSEGYFSSEDDTKRKTDQLSEKLKHLGSKPLLKSSSAARKSESNAKVANFQNKEGTMTRSVEQLKQNKYPHKNLSLELNCPEKMNTTFWGPQKSATINDLSRIQSKNYDDTISEKQYTKNIDQEDDYGHSSDNEKVSNISYARSKSISSKEHNLSSVTCTTEMNPDQSAETNIDTFNVSNIDAGSDGEVSEAGTYTVHKDYTDEEKARMDIDKVFNVGVFPEDESNEACVHSFKMSASRDNNTWISEWASQVAEHNSLPPVIGGPTGRTPPLSPSKIPSPIHTRSQRLSRSRNVSFCCIGCFYQRLMGCKLLTLCTPNYLSILLPTTPYHFQCFI